MHEGRQAIHQSFLEVDVRKAASFDSHVFLFKGAQIRNTIQVRLSGEDASCSLNGLYVGSGQQVIENHTLIEHQKPRGTSRELYKGILDDQARGLFDGLIVVQKEAQKTDSIQTNKNMLLSPEARASANPELKIFANDVKCKHGATIGQISADSLFYLALARDSGAGSAAPSGVCVRERDDSAGRCPGAARYSIPMSELSDLYQEVILDHSRHPHNYHAMPDASRQAKGHNPLCGDQVTVYVKLNGDKINDITFEVHGCAISKSSASIMTDIVKGKSKTESFCSPVRKISPDGDG